MAASLGLYMLKPLSFCSHTTSVAVTLFTFISGLSGEQRKLEKALARSKVPLTFAERAGIRDGTRVP